jgi:hypothetical protein
LNLAAVAGNRQVTLTWQPTFGAESYSVLWSTNNGGPYVVAATGIPSTGYVHTSAVSGVVNYYRVSAVSPCGQSAPSLTAAVVLPLPALSASLGGGALTIRWPAWASDWGLWSATNLTAPVGWMRVTNAAILDGQFIVTLPVIAGNCFFRLASP